MDYDYNELSKAMQDFYNKLYHGQIEERPEYVEIGDKLLANKALFPLFAGLAEIRSDVISSDREVAALALAVNPWLLDMVPAAAAEPADTVPAARPEVKKTHDKGTAKSYRVAHDYQHKGTEIYFDGRPSEEVRDILKSFGMRWHNVKKCWYGRVKENDIILAIAPAL